MEYTEKYKLFNILSTKVSFIKFSELSLNKGSQFSMFACLIVLSMQYLSKTIDLYPIRSMHSPCNTLQCVSTYVFTRERFYKCRM